MGQSATPDIWMVLWPVIIGGLLTMLPVVVGQVWAAIFEWKKAATEAAHVSLRAAVALERFSVTCWPVSYSGLEHYERTRAPFREDMPALTGLPVQSEWKAVNIDLADAVLSFQSRIDASEVTAAHARYFEGNPFNIESEVLKIGREAWALAERLRKSHGLPLQVALRQTLGSMLD